MSLIRKLAGQTAIYGVSSIMGRVINSLLTPFYVRVLGAGENGVIFDFYTLSAFIMILFTYRLETAYFRFASKDENKEQSFITGLNSIFLTSLLFLLILLGFSHPIATLLKYPDHPEYVQIFAWILFMDALAEIPFARLRLDGKAKRFATIRIIWVLVPKVVNNGWMPFLRPIAGLVYNPEIRVGYVFYSNLIASFTVLILLSPVYKRARLLIDKKLALRMFNYSWPLMIVSFAGVINEMLDRQLLKYLLPFSIEKNKEQLGIYGANYKLAMLVSLFRQAFMYAAEPFFFSHSKKKDSPVLYARIAKYFTITNIIGFLIITLYLHIFKYYVGKDGSLFHEGLKVVPILLMANIFLGLYYNISSWFKLTDKTHYGIIISLTGAAITVILNIWWIPIFGYVGSAWATLICYFAMAMLCYYLGRKHYPLQYDWLSIFGYLVLGVVILSIHNWLVNLLHPGFTVTTVFATIGLLLFLAVVYFKEKKTLLTIKNTKLN